MHNSTTQPPLWLALLPIIFLIALLTANVAIMGDEATSGPAQLALFMTAAFAALLGRFYLKMDYKELEKGAIDSISLAMQACLILLVVGALIGLWIMAGIVPTLIYYGIVLINPSVFLLVACVACSLVAISIGSSWSAMGTIGVALIAIGETLGVPQPMVAGAVISGAYFGDKLSPLSDTTNLAPAIAGTDLFSHVRHLLYTTLPAYALALIGFTVLGFFYERETYDPAFVVAVTEAIQTHFNIGLHTLIGPALLLVLIAMGTPALPAIAIGALLGAIEVLLFQQQLLPEGISGIYQALLTTAHSGFSIDTGNELIDGLFSRGGMLNMLNTILIVLSAMTFGGVMEATGMLRRIANSILHLVHGAGSLIGATVGTCIVFNLTASDQYISIVVPGRMFRQAYEDYRLDAKNLSRALEDGGTVTSVLVPWNTCGAYATGVLGVSTLAYLPFCFFNWLCPIVAIFLAAMKFSIARIQDDENGSPKNSDDLAKP